MLEQYYRINQAVGISINILTANTFVINACAVEVSQNQLTLKQRLTDIEDVKLLKKKFPAKSSVAVSLYGKGVLQKQVEKIDIIDQNTFGQILPNANINDFYIQNFISGDKSFISVIRKTDADKWLTELADLEFTPRIISLGVFPVKNIESQLNVYGGDLIFDGNIIHRNEEFEWLSNTYAPSSTASFQLKIESDLIDEKLVLPYALAFQLVLATKLPVIKANIDSVAASFESFLTAQKLKVHTVIALGLLFLLLLINFFVLSSLTLSNNDLTGKISFSTQATSNLQELTAKVKDQETFLEHLGWDGGINKSVLIDQLAALLPTEVSLDEININPIDKAESNAMIEKKFTNGKIKVIGKADEILAVNEWIARIKTKKWVKNVQLDNYTFDNEINAGRFFILVDF